jgi:tRNA(fMet)-specific endonuclease VapC
MQNAGGSALNVVRRYGLGEEYAISVVTIAELQHGVRRADSPTRRRMRERFLADVMQTFNIYPMDIAIALRVGSVDADLKRNGQSLLLADLIIASTALELGYSIATLNLKDFERIPGLRIAQPSTQL